MIEYILVLLVLLFAAVSFILGYDRFKSRRRRPESSLYVQSLIDLLDGKPESAFTKLRQVVAEDSNNVDAYVRLGQILRENKNPDRALQVHKDLTLRGTLSGEEKKAILKQLVADYLALQELSTSERALKEIISIDPHDRWAHAALLELQEKARRWEDAYQTAATVLRLQGNKSKKPLARYKFQMAEQLYRKREYHKARIVYKEAIGLDSAFVPAYLAIGDSYRDEQRFEDAVNFWSRLISAVPEKGHLVIDRLKKTLFDLGRFGDIVQICNSILEHDPRNLEARRTLAEFHEKKGDLDAAAELLEQIFEDYSDDYLTVLELARLYLEKGDKKKVDGLLRSLERKREMLKQTVPERPASTSAAGA
ncbi:MAG TPA: tetratricopeptide repeat protein [Acidobacteriota bacterium]|nr:tetratricopeptide repeat protein [Acidobacteriota bacterium]